MKKCLLVTILFLGILPVASARNPKYEKMLYIQAQEKSLFTVHYTLESRAENPELWHQYVLDIGKQSSHFYDWNEYVDRLINDSICRANGQNPIEGRYDIRSLGVKGFHPNPTHLHVLKNMKEGDYLLVADMIASFGAPSFVYYQEPIADYGWEMMEGDSIIGGYPCQKAQMTYRGHTWEVWFTPEIAVSDGPWKLCGLPGLILDAADKEGDYHFMFTGLENDTDREILLSTYHMKRTTAPNMYKMFLKADEEALARMPTDISLRMGKAKPRIRLLEHLSEK